MRYQFNFPLQLFPHYFGNTSRNTFKSLTLSRLTLSLIQYLLLRFYLQSSIQLFLLGRHNRKIGSGRNSHQVKCNFGFISGAIWCHSDAESLVDHNKGECLIDKFESLKTPAHDKRDERRKSKNGKKYFGQQFAKCILQHRISGMCLVGSYRTVVFNLGREFGRPRKVIASIHKSVFVVMRFKTLRFQ